MKKYRNMLFVCCFLSAGIPLMIACMISYHIYMEEITKQNDQNAQTVGMQIQNEVERILSETRQYYLEAIQGDDVEWLIRTDSIPYSEVSFLDAGQKALNGPTYLGSYIQGYAFLNLKKGWILTNNGMFPMDEVKNQEQMSACLEEVSARSNNLFWNNHLTEASPFEGGVSKSRVLDFSGFQMVLRMPGTPAPTEQLLLVQLNYRNLIKAGTDPEWGEYQICILDREGSALFSTDAVLLEYCVSNPALLGQAEGMTELRLEDGRKLRVNLSGFTDNGMIYLTGYDLGQVRSGGVRIIEASVKILAVVILVLALCLLVTRYLYRPVGHLDQYVSSMTQTKQKPAETSRDEFVRIRENVGQLWKEKEGQRQLVLEQQKLLTEQFLLRCVRGELTSEEVAAGQKQLNLGTCRYYRLLACELMTEKETDQDSELEQKALCLLAVQRMPVGLTGLLAAAPLCYGSLILMIAGAQEEAELEEKKLEICGRMNEYVQDQFGCPVIVGISQVFLKLKYLRVACNECVEALRNTENTSQNAILCYEEITRDDAILTGYDFAVESALVRAVDCGQSEEAVQLVDRFVNSLDNRGISHHDRSFFLYRLAVAVMSVLSDAGLSVNRVYGEEPETDNLFTELHHIYDSGRLKEYLTNRIVLPAISALRQYRYDSSSDIFRKVMELVRESNGDITLAECAGRLNYHSSYIWKVLKSERNMTFTDLVNAQKLEAAKQMLIHSDDTVAEIAEKLNYSNTQNFIRFFGKYEQTTPGKWRREHQEEAGKRK